MFDKAIANFRPRPRIRTLDWCRENIQTSEGRPYDHAAYPHHGAPGGLFDAFDCPQYLAIALQFGSQIAKTFGGICCLLKNADCDPCAMMFVSANQKLAVEEVTQKWYPMLERCPSLRDQLRPEHRRKQDFIALDACRVFVGWSKSASSLASKSVRIGHANELDKWEQTKTSKEADPAKLFSERFKSFPSHKIIFESTPALKSTSRIERLRLASFNATYHVPCPKCWRYQTLRMNPVDGRGGIVWNKNEGGKSDKDVAHKTARYVCAHCEAELGDEHRGTMMRNGVWIPEGCGCDDAKARECAEQWRQPGRPVWRGWKESPWIIGEPARDGRDAGYLLSSLYATALSWGKIASEFVDCQKNPQNLRNFVNGWLAETWEHVRSSQTWEKLYDNINSDTDRLLVPNWASLLTFGMDRQVDKFVYVVDAWGPDNHACTIDYGEADTLHEVYRKVIARRYEYCDRNGGLKIAFGLVDSGYKPEGIYEFSRECVRNRLAIWPCKGSSKPLQDLYVRTQLKENTSMPGMKLYHVDTARTQAWMDKVLSDGTAKVFNAPAWEHQEYCEQLLNDAALVEEDASNNEKERWVRANTSVPNDYRDCRRYSYVAMKIITRNKELPTRRMPDVSSKAPTEAKAEPSRFIQRPGGWIPPRRHG